MSFIGTDIVHNVLLSQVQSSRAIWFVYLLGNVGTGVIVASLYKNSEEDGDAFFFLYVMAWTITHILWPVPGLILGLAASGLAYLRITGKIAGLPSLLRRLIYTISVILFFWLVFFRVKFWLISYNRESVLSNGEAFVGIAGFTQMEIIFVALVIFVVVRLRLKIPSYVTKGLLILLAVWSVFVWDRRSAENRGLEGDYIVDSLLEQIPPGAQVYWEGDPKGPWFLLGRPSYFADAQGAGVVFSKPLAVEYQKRSLIARAIDGVDYMDIWRPFKSADERKERFRAQKLLIRIDLVDACGSAPELDFMVLTRQVDGAYLMVWHPRTADQTAGGQSASDDLVPTDPHFLYRCADFR